jgi:17beta-estradiol 17-dehydrogenase / very-long-chain 3-oxoacyl-CoA reductase
MAYEGALQLLGLLVLLQLSFKICSFTWLYTRSSSLYRYLRDSKDSDQKNWALVTGASDGIGQAFAAELCRQNFNVVLHGRNPTKLEKVQKELLRKYPESQVRIVVADANHSLSSSLEQDILSKVKDLKLSVLINNVGGTAGLQAPNEIFNSIDKYSVAAVDGLININARFTSQITRLLLPLLCKRPRSLIMNISSAASLGMPYLSVYSGTKAYINSWSDALTTEMEGEKRNVEVLAIVVGSVQTTSNSNPLSLFHPRADAFARATLDKVGCGKAVVYGYLPHALQAVFFSFFPDWMARKAVFSVMKERKEAADAEGKKA